MTQQMQAALAFIRRYMSEHNGRSPSFEEIRLELGLASKSGVYRIVSLLEERGFLRRQYAHARSIQLVEGPAAADMERWSTAELYRVRRAATAILQARAA